jgi:hypothetical protein
MLLLTTINILGVLETTLMTPSHTYIAASFLYKFGSEIGHVIYSTIFFKEITVPEFLMDLIPLIANLHIAKLQKLTLLSNNMKYKSILKI